MVQHHLTFLARRSRYVDKRSVGGLVRGGGAFKLLIHRYPFCANVDTPVTVNAELVTAIKPSTIEPIRGDLLWWTTLNRPRIMGFSSFLTVHAA